MKIGIFIAIAATITMIDSQPVFALIPPYEYEDNNILYYNPDASEPEICTPTATYSGGTINLPTETINKLVAMKVKELAEQNMSSYKKAEQKTGVPWYMLAALHFREGSMNPRKSIADGEPITGKQYTSMDGVKIGANLDDDAVFAAEHFIEMARMVYGINIGRSGTLTTGEIGNAFLAYNRGFLYKNRGLDFTKSGYVMQGIDSNHIGGDWKYLDPFGGHKKSRQLLNSNPGALAVIAYLNPNSGTPTDDPTDPTAVLTTPNNSSDTGCEEGDSSAFGDGDGVVQGNIVATAKSLAWPHRVQIPRVTAPRGGQSAAKPNYVAEVNKFIKSFHDAEYTDCGIFIATVMRSSGVDPNYPARGTSTQLSYVKKSPKYKTFTAQSEAELKPGDILVRPGHTYMYVGSYVAAKDGKTYKAIGASWHTRPPSGHSLYLTGNSPGDISSSDDFLVARFIGGDS